MKQWLVAIVLMAMTDPLLAGTTRNGTLVELFTSQGCSSCPPAELLFNSIDSISPDAIPLAFHVDYWDKIGWKDPFSSAEWTARQNIYAARLGLPLIYTPQVIVAGKEEFVGSHRSKLERALLEKREPVAILTIEIIDKSDLNRDSSIDANLKIEPRGNAVGEQHLFVALAESGLITKVPRGENAGKTLEENHVVRRLSKIASISAEGMRPTSERRFSISIDANRNRAKLSIIAFLQSPADLSIGAAAEINFAE